MPDKPGSPASPPSSVDTAANRESASVDERAEVLRVLEPFARVWRSRPAFDVTAPFNVTCEVGEFGAWADAAALYDRLCTTLPNPPTPKDGEKASNGLPSGDDAPSPQAHQKEKNDAG